MKALQLAVCMIFLCGCIPDEPVKPLSQKDADGFVLQLLAAQLNAAQTNWTFSVEPRAK